MPRIHLPLVVALATVGLAGCADGTGSKTPRAAAPVDLGTEPITQIKNQPSIRDINGMAYLDGPVDKWPSEKPSPKTPASTPSVKSDPAGGEAAPTLGGGSASGVASTPVSAPVAATAPVRKTTTSTRPATSSSSGRIGSSVSIAGIKAGLRVRVKLVGVDDSADEGELGEAEDGKRFVVARLRLTNVGRRQYSDVPANSAKIVLSNDTQEGASVVGGAYCPPAEIVTLAPRAKRAVCAVFEIDEDLKPRTLQFKLNSGFADDTAEFKLRR